MNVLFMSLSCRSFRYRISMLSCLCYSGDDLLAFVNKFIHFVLFKNRKQTIPDKGNNLEYSMIHVFMTLMAALLLEAKMLDKLESLEAVYVLRAMTTLSCKQIVGIDKVPPISSMMCLSVLIGNQ